MVAGDANLRDAVRRVAGGDVRQCSVMPRNELREDVLRLLLIWMQARMKC